MTDRPTLIAQIAEALRENGLTAAIGAVATALVGLAVAVTRKAFTNEAEDRASEQAHRARLEQDLYQMRQLLFTVFQHAPPQIVDPPPPANPPQSTDE
ncbi:hypothetical protein [Roseovarius sp. E0-M6]|uniref:hypothetical protein n=1 Tax=Roseovarius sp. E0-M6 TaxID=3127118 RepID=UPI0030102289